MGVRRERVALRIVRGAIVGALRLGKGVDKGGCFRGKGDGYRDNIYEENLLTETERVMAVEVFNNSHGL